MLGLPPLALSGEVVEEEINVTKQNKKAKLYMVTSN